MNNQATSSQLQLKQIADDLARVKQLRSKGILPCSVTTRTVQEDDIIFEPIVLLPVRTEAEGSEVTIEDCRNVLDYYFWESHFEDYEFTDVNLSEALYGEGTRPSDMEQWLNALNIFQSYFHFTNDELGNKFAFFDGYDGQIKLSTIGLDLIEATRHMYRTFGYKLMEKNGCETPTLETK